MKVYDEAKTEELLTNLKKDGIEVKDLSKLFCKRIIGVRIKAARGRMLTGINDLKTLGISTKSTNKDVEDFKKENIYAGSFRLFDKKIIQQFDNVIANVRQLIYRYSMTNDGTTYYMTLENYREFKEVFETKYFDRFQELKEDLIDNLSEYKRIFERKFTNWLKTTELDKNDIELAKLKYLSKFPSELEVRRNCILDYYTISYPVFNEIDIDGISVDVANDILKDKDVSVVDTFYNLIGDSLLNLFDITSKMIDTIEITTKDEETMPLSTSMSSRTKGLFNKTIETINNNNHILKNDKIDSIIYLLTRTFINKENKSGTQISNGEAVTISETILSIIYNYAKYLGVDESLEKVISDSNYNVEEFELLEDIDLKLF